MSSFWALLHAGGSVLKLCNGFILLLQTRSLDISVEMLPNLLELNEFLVCQVTAQERVSLQSIGEALNGSCLR
jgi:hypothetical protein